MTIKKIHETILEIICIPKIMGQDDKVSFYSLLKKAGYFDLHDQITVEEIRKALLPHSDYVKDWIQYSEDQRCAPAWFFRQNGADYEVGFFSLKKDNTPPIKYLDPSEACATFIKHQIEETRLAG